MNEREQQFHDTFKERTGFDLIFEPARFRVTVDGVDFRYTPDFYCPQTDTFIEVVGSRQAFHQDKFKIKAFLNTYRVNFELRRPDCVPYDCESFDYRTRKPFAAVSNVPEFQNERIELAQKIRAAILTDNLPVSEIAKRAGVDPGLIWHIAKGRTIAPHLDTAKKVAAAVDGVAWDWCKKKQVVTGLRAARRGKGLTQRKLARMVGVSGSLISHIESGKGRNPSWETTFRLAQVLGIKPHEIFSASTDEKATA